MLALCGIADVAVTDEQAIYDPSDPDDKLLLDLKARRRQRSPAGSGRRRNAA